MNLEITNNPKKEDDEFVIRKIREYNSKFVLNEFELLSIFYKSDDGEIIGGLTGKTFWNWLHIEYLWVSESERDKDIGSKIILAAENEAIKRGCVGSMLDTFSFQAPEFYKKLGYSVIGSLSDYVSKYERYYLKKKLKTSTFSPTTDTCSGIEVK